MSEFVCRGKFLQIQPQLKSHRSEGDKSIHFWNGIPKISKSDP